MPAWRSTVRTLRTSSNPISRLLRPAGLLRAAARQLERVEKLRAAKSLVQHARLQRERVFDEELSRLEEAVRKMTSLLTIQGGKVVHAQAPFADEPETCAALIRGAS